MATTQELLAQQLLQIGASPQSGEIAKGLASFLGARALKKSEDVRQEKLRRQTGVLQEALLATGANPAIVDTLALGNDVKGLQSALLQQLKPVSPVTLSQGQQLINPQTGDIIGGVAAKPTTVGAGGSIFSGGGDLLATAPDPLGQQRLDIQREQREQQQQQRIEDLGFKRSAEKRAEAKESREIGAKKVGGFKLKEGFSPSVTAVGKFKDTVASSNAIFKTLNKLEGIFNKQGTETLPSASKGNMKQLIDSLTFSMAALEGQGALQEADKRLIQDVLPNPTKFSFNSRTKEKFKQFRDIINGKVSSLADVNGYERSGSKTNGKTKFVFNPSTGGLE